MDAKEMMLKLQEPFTAEEIEWRVGSTNKDKTKGLALAYVTNRAIQNRLDDVFGCFGWQNEFKEWKSNSQICGISVYDEDKKIWITKWDGSDDSATEAVKGGLSDSMKRAAYQWGIGRYLYNLPQTWVNLKDGKYLAETPKLPQWALPKGYKEPGKPKEKMPVDLKSDKSLTIDADEQAKLFAIVPKEKQKVAKDIMLKYGCTSSKEIKKADYQKIVAEIQENINKGA